VDLDDLAERLARLENVLRGSPIEMAAVIRGVQARITEVLRGLGPTAEQLTSRVRVTALSQPLPI